VEAEYSVLIVKQRELLSFIVLVKNPWPMAYLLLGLLIGSEPQLTIPIVVHY
jgi:hypothetical protein